MNWKVEPRRVWWPYDKHQDSRYCVKDCLQKNLSPISSQRKVDMVRKQIMIVTKNDWKLLNTNLEKNKQGKSIHIPKETPVLPVIFEFLFLDIFVFLYIVIVFVYLNHICFSFLSFISICIAGNMLHVWQDLACKSFIINCLFLRWFFQYFSLSPFQDLFRQIWPKWPISHLISYHW